MRWNNIDKLKDDKPNYDFEKMYFDSLETNNKTIESDYNNKDINVFDSCYNINIIRKYLWSNPSDSTIELAQITDGMKILDCGCGTGNVAIYICQTIPNVTIDCIVNSENLFNITKTNIQNNKLENRINVYLMDFDKLENPVLSKQYDRIMFLESIGYSKNINNLLNTVHTLLKHDGKLFIKTPQFNNHTSVDNYKLCNDVVDIWKYNFSTLPTFINDVKKTAFYNNIKYISYSPLLSLPMFLNPKDYLNGIKFASKNNIEKKNNFAIMFKNILRNNIFILNKNNNIEPMITKNIIDDTLNIEETPENIKLDIIEKVSDSVDIETTVNNI